MSDLLSLVQRAQPFLEYFQPVNPRSGLAAQIKLADPSGFQPDQLAEFASTLHDLLLDVLSSVCNQEAQDGVRQVCEEFDAALYTLS